MGIRSELGVITQTITARGFTAEGFESVAGALERAVVERGEDGCAVAAYVAGRKVVDLWAGPTWRDDTLTVIFSCTKGITTLCAQILYDRGLLDLDARVSTYWPEYGACGKEKTLVLDLLTHRSGVVTFPRYWEVIDKEGKGLDDWELMTSRLAASPPSWEPGTLSQYHNGTFGFLVGEVIRRIDGRTPGRFLADEVAKPFGLDLYLGAPDRILSRVANIKAPPPPNYNQYTPEQKQLAEMFQAMTVAAQEKVRSGDPLALEAWFIASGFIHPDTEDVNGFYADLANRAFVRKAELPSGNAIGGARDLARMYAVLACGGELDGVRLVSPESITVFNTEQTTVAPMMLTLCVGYHRPGPGYDFVGATTFGHAGAGGNMGFADPENKLSFAFVKNQMRSEPGGAAADLAEAVYSCL